MHAFFQDGGSGSRGGSLMGTSGPIVPGAGGSLIGRSSGSGSGNAGFVGSGISAGRGMSTSSDGSMSDGRPVHERHHQDHHEHQAQQAGRTVAPGSTVRPGWNGADQQQNKNDEKNGGHAGSPNSVCQTMSIA